MMKLFSTSLSSQVKRISGFFGVLVATLIPLVKPPVASAQLPFEDIDGHWAQLCIHQLAQQGVVSGYPDGLFRPDIPVTRAEFAIMVNNAFPFVPIVRTDNPNYADIPESYWAQPAITEAYRTDFMIGYPDNTFQPKMNIPRVEVLVALVSGLNYSPDLTFDLPEELEVELEQEATEILQTSLIDAPAIPRYAYNAIATALRNNLVVNYPDRNQFEPNELANRGEVAAFICQALDTPGGIASDYIAGTE
jgi:hypothetical protein